MAKRNSLYRLILLLLIVVGGMAAGDLLAQRPRRPREFFTALNNVVKVDQLAGANAGEQIRSCWEVELPGTGGICDARGFRGNQVISADPFVGLTKDIHLILGTARFSITADVFFPERLVLEMSKGSILAPSGGVTVTIAGPLIAPDSQIFTTGGTIEFDPPPHRITPFWWGAHGDGVRDDAFALDAAVLSVGDTTETRRGGATIDISAPTAIASTITIRRKSIILKCHGWGLDTATPPEGTYLKWIGTRSSSTIAGAPTGADRTTNVVTITTTAAHGFSIRNLVTVAGVTDTSFNGTFLIASVPLTTTFTYAQVAANATSGSGTASVGTPMVEFRDVQGGGGIRDCKFIGDSTNPPEAAISMFETNDTVPNSRNFFSNIEITSTSGLGFDTGIRFHGDLNANNSENYFENIFIQNCVDSGIRIAGTQMILNRFDNLNIQGCANGIWDSAGQSGANWFFANNGVDIFTPFRDEFSTQTRPLIHIHRLQSEASGRMAFFEGNVIFNVIGGSWQISTSTNPDGRIIATPFAATHTVTIRDFVFRQDSAPPTPPFLEIETPSPGASSQDIVLDGIQGWGNLTGGTNGMNAATPTTTDRSNVYLRQITQGAGSNYIAVTQDRRVGISGTTQWDINRFEPQGPRLTYSRAVTFTDADTTPSVAEGNWFTVTNSGATTVTFFDDGVDGQPIYLLFTNGNTTLQDGATLNLSGAANFTPTADDIVTLVFNGTNWYEISRSLN